MAKRKKNTKKVTPKKAVAKKSTVSKKTPRKKKIKEGSKITFSTSTLTIRKPKSESILKLRHQEEAVAHQQKMDKLKKKERPNVRYGFHIESIKVNKRNVITDIQFLYKGTLYIPKSYKDSVKPANGSVLGSIKVPEGRKPEDHVIGKKDYSKLDRKEIIDWLTKNVRRGYIEAMRKQINTKIFPENKKIDKLPWKY